MSQPAPRTTRRRWRARRRFWWLLGGVLLAIVALVASSLGWFLGTIQVPGGIPTDPTSVTGLGAPDQRINVLLMGHDVAQLRNGRSQPTRTDTIMVASFDPLTHEVALLSIPRDTKVEIPGRKGADKINAAHAYGGPDLTLQTVNDFLGVTIPDYVDIGVAGFVKIVDELGGVDVYVPFDMNYDDPAQDLHIHLKKGQQHLDGYDAMGFVRDRYDDPRNDFGRIDRQHQFIAAMAEKVSQPSAWLHFLPIMSTLAENVRTTLDTSTMLKLAQIGRAAGAGGLVSATLPTKDLWENGISYQAIDEETVRAYVDRYLLGIDPERNRGVRVRILNGTDVRGLAAAMSRYLGAMGYDVVQVGNASTEAGETTAVYAQPDAGVAAKVLVRTLHQTWSGIDEPFTADSLDPADRSMPPPSEAASESEAASSEGAGAGWDVTIVLGADVARSGVPEPAPLPSESSPKK